MCEVRVSDRAVNRPLAKNQATSEQETLATEKVSEIGHPSKQQSWAAYFHWANSDTLDNHAYIGVPSGLLNSLLSGGAYAPQTPGFIFVVHTPCRI